MVAQIGRSRVINRLDIGWLKIELKIMDRNSMEGVDFQGGACERWCITQ